MSGLSPELVTALRELRDIHVPPTSVSPSPLPALEGLPFQLALASTTVLLLLAIALVVRWHRRRDQRRVLRALHDSLERYARDRDAGSLLATASFLLRNHACARLGRQAAGLTGEAWLRFLDAEGGGGAFVDGPGRWLITAPFAPPATHSEIDVSAVLRVVQEWLMRHP